MRQAAPEGACAPKAEVRHSLGPLRPHKGLHIAMFKVRIMWPGPLGIAYGTRRGAPKVWSEK